MFENIMFMFMFVIIVEYGIMDYILVGYNSLFLVFIDCDINWLKFLICCLISFEYDYFRSRMEGKV